MKHSTCRLLLALLPALAYCQMPKELESIAWEKGPTVSHLGSQAEIKVPKGYVFAGAAGARKFLELNQNLVGDSLLGMIAPESFDWFAIFNFDDVGYIKDDEKAELDAGAMMASMKEGSAESNEERKSRGWAAIHMLGWIQKPHYDESTHNLEWTTRIQAEGSGESANHNTRYLGRHGVMRVTMAASPKEIAAIRPLFRDVMDGFSYTPENSYAAWASGDRVAEYGLTALVVGGAAAAASKTGLFKSLGKFAILGIAAVGAFLKRLFTGRPKEANETEAV